MSLKSLHKYAGEPFKGLKLNWGIVSDLHIIFYIYHISLIDPAECMGNGVRIVDDGHISDIDSSRNYIRLIRSWLLIYILLIGD